MKIILSRKGFDSSAGGVPGPILPDGQIVSLPIPDPRSTARGQEFVLSGRDFPESAKWLRALVRRYVWDRRWPKCADRRENRSQT